MRWTEAKDVLMMREVVASGLFTHNSGSRERSNGWQAVATNLNAIDGFMVTTRAVRDRITNLMKKFSAQNNAEKKATGIGGSEPTESEILLQDLMDMSADSEMRKEEEKSAKNEIENQEKQKALDIRSTAMETFKEIKKRKNEDEPAKEKKTRRSNIDTLSFLKEKIESDRELKTRVIESNTNARNEFQQMLLHQQPHNNDVLEVFAKQSQSQSEQFQTMMAQQQNQTLALIQALVSKDM